MTKIVFALLLSAVMAHGAASFNPPGALNNTVYINPGASLFAASANAPLGSEIQVASGTFTNGLTNLWINGSWYFHGSLLRLYDIPTNTTGAGIFDDRFYGAKTCSVSGVLSIEYHSGTNVFLDTNTCTFGYNTNGLGPIVVTNPSTYIRWSADTRLGLCGQTPTPFAITVLHCVSNSYFRTFDIYNLNPNGTNLITTNCTADPGTFYSISTGCAGIHWGDSDMIFEGNIRPMTLQAVWGDNLTTNGAQLWASGHVCDGKWYIVGRTNTFKIWANFDEYLNTQGTIGDCLDLWNSGSHYFVGKKMSTKTGFAIEMQNPDTGQTDTNLIAWINIDKMSGSNGWINVKHGDLRGRVGHFEQNGPNNGTAGILTTNVSSYLDISGEAMYHPNVAIMISGSNSILHNYRVYTTNRDPILVTGGGFRMHNLIVVTPATATNSIRSAAAQTIKAYGLSSLRSNVHANITISTGSTNVTVAPSID